MWSFICAWICKDELFIIVAVLDFVAAVRSGSFCSACKWVLFAIWFCLRVVRSSLWKMRGHYSQSKKKTFNIWTKRSGIYVSHYYIFSHVLIPIATKSDSESRFGAELNKPCSNLLSESDFVAMGMRSEQSVVQVRVFIIFLRFHCGFGSRLFCYCLRCCAPVVWFRLRWERKIWKKMRDGNRVKFIFKFINIQLTKFAVFFKK